jgi:hypothetical protein
MRPLPHLHTPCPEATPHRFLARPAHQATVTMQGCKQSGSFAIYTVTFGWTGTLASQNNFIVDSLKPFGPCNQLGTGCSSWSATSGQEVLCVNDDGNFGSDTPKCPDAWCAPHPHPQPRAPPAGRLRASPAGANPPHAR